MTGLAAASVLAAGLLYAFVQKGHRLGTRYVQSPRLVRDK